MHQRPLEQLARCTLNPILPMHYTPLPKPVRITEHRWPEGTKPVVSVWCITYNHKDFIAEAIESFLMQETTFPVEILIHDDASTDGTADIVRAYQQRYPQLIRAKLQAENQYSQQKPGMAQFYETAQGEFVAMCEGDDYWLVAWKLEWQATYLRQHSEAAALITSYRVDNKDRSFDQMMPDKVYRHGDVFPLLNLVYVPVRTTLMRNHKAVGELRYRFRHIRAGDFILAYICSLYGEIHSQPLVTGCYRDWGGGSYSQHGTVGKLQFHVDNIWKLCDTLHLPYAGFMNRYLARRAATCIAARGGTSSPQRRAIKMDEFRVFYRARRGSRAGFLILVGLNLLRRAVSKILPVW